MNALANGTMVLLGARDEASISLSAEAKTAIKSLGATRIDDLAFRGGYALVGHKGGSALSESVSVTGAGYAVALGQMEVVISVDASSWKHVGANLLG